MSKQLKATHQGELELNGFKISCAVLNDGTRVLVNRSLANALGIKGAGSYWQHKKEGKGAMLPEYLSAKYLRPHISEELIVKLTNPVVYKNPNNILTEGIPASLLTDICDVYVKASKKGAFDKNPNIPENAYKMILGFSKVGITSLVDEVTGYQYDREKDELQKILKAYISEELLPWQKRFPDVFYRELFKLKGWDFTVKGIKKRPGVVGTWTNTLIYEQLPEGVLEELKKNTPKSKKGNYVARLHQGLTEDIGNQHLTAQINQIIMLFKLSSDMDDMWKNFDKIKINKETPSMPLALEAEKEDNKQLELDILDAHAPDEVELTPFNKNLKKALDFNPRDKE